jgi:hypothetical protein
MFDCTLKHNGDSITFQLPNNDSEQVTITYHYGYDNYTEIKKCFTYEAQERWNVAQDIGFKTIFIPSQWDMI